MITSQEIAWVAGILEGEGYFHCQEPPARHSKNPQPSIRLRMTDKDVVDRVGKLFGGKVGKLAGRTTSHKDIWQVAVSGSTAAGWMMTLLPFLGERRKAKVIYCLKRWKTGGPTAKQYVTRSWKRAARYV